MSNMYPITKNSVVPNTSQLPNAANSGSSLDKDDFLRILITQLQNQDPTNPMQDREFIAQMAQFSSLEQTVNLTKAFETFAASQQQSQLVQYSAFIGKQVKWQELTGDLKENGEPQSTEGTGVVKTVRFIDGSVEFLLEDGKKLSPANISELTAN